MPRKQSKNKRKPAANKAAGKKTPSTKSKKKADLVFPDKFPFWARLKISKNRTTLVIDETKIEDKKTKKTEDAFVHREATHTKKKEFEEITPNPDKTDKNSMYLKKPSKLPKRLFKPHNKNLSMPNNLKARYDKNNLKKGK